MKVNSLLIIILSLFSCFGLFAQQTGIAQITVEAGKFDRENVLVSADLQGLNLEMAIGGLLLTEISSGKVIASQLDMQKGPKLYWKMEDKLTSGKSRKYVLSRSPAKALDNTKSMEVQNVHGNLIIKSNGKNVLQYNFNAPSLPDGVPEIYRRAGFIHPLWSPSGEVLTRIQPPDHYHHVGIWNPWTHTEFKGKEIDFWNIVAGQGTVKPVTITSTTANNLYAGFQVIHDHVDLNGITPVGFEVALKEEWDVRVWNMNENAWVIDFVSTLNCATDSALTIKEYRYQGFGFRATEKWNDQNTTMLTSEGKNKSDGNGTRARWCDINGATSTGYSGILFITSPANFNYPEPIRIWPTGMNDGKENVFFNFNPAMDRDWKLMPGNTYQLRYRMYVYDDKIDTAQAEKIWQDFAYPPKVSLQVK